MITTFTYVKGYCKQEVNKLFSMFTWDRTRSNHLEFKKDKFRLGQTFKL